MNDLIAYYINLEIRINKCEKIESQFKKINQNTIMINYERFNAINGKQFDIPKLWLPFTKELYMRHGQFGCYYSHKKCYENFLNSNKKYLLILEDDIIFIDNFVDELENILEILNTKINDFDFLYLSRSNILFEGMYDGCDTKYKDEYIYSPKQCGYGFHSYILSNNGAKKFLEILNNYEQNMWTKNIGLPIDALQYFKQYGKGINIDLNIYALKKDLVICNPEGSDTSS